ncbi:MAG TPA: RDD family protein [Acidimicrobiia bacterium]
MSQPEPETEKGFFGRMASGASDRVLEIVDPNLVLAHVDVDALLDKIDVNALLDRVDINRLLERVDADALMDRVDIDALMGRVDIQAIVERAGIPEIVAESTSHLTGSALDMFRRPIVGLDEIVFRGANRIFRRDPTKLPEGPGDLIQWVDERKTKEGVKTGRYAGPLTRLLAVMIDSVVVSFGFTLLVAGLVFVVRLFQPDFEIPDGSGVFYGIALVVWSFFYLWISYAVFGKTIGKMIVGVRVVSADGHAVLKGRQPFIRVLTYPISFLIFGLGLLGIVFNPQRQAWHDRFASTTVVYDWGSRTATMPTPLADYLARKGADV